MTDVKTDALPADITNPPDPTKWLAWSDNAPFTHTDASSLQLVAKWECDTQGRQIKVQDAEGTITCTAYGSNQTRTYAGWDMSNHVATLPIHVTRTNDDDLAIETYSLDPTVVTAGYNSSTNLPTGVEANEGQSHYVTWIRYGYNATTALLEKVDSYHSIPTTNGDVGAMSTNFYRTFYRYDGIGRRTHTIQVVSGTDSTGLTGCVEQVTKTDYDALDRVIAVSRGVSDAGDVMKTVTVYDTDPATLTQVAATYYDEPTLGSGTSGVGDGLVTSSVAYYDATNIDSSHAVKTIYHYNWRGQLRGIEPSTAPYTVRDIDNMGRTVATAQFKTNPTWSTVVSTDGYAATTAANRGTLGKIYYDKMDRVYASETYSVDASTGASGDKIIANYYYNRNSQLAGTCSPARGAAEYAYDGVGRQVEVRVATGLAAALYTSGAFNYRNPQPGATTGGNDGVVQISRFTYDNVGDVTAQVTMEVNHDDTDGLSLDGANKDFIQTTSFSWYDGVHRLTGTAAYGTNTTTWSYADSPTRPSSIPAGSDTVLVTSLAYEPATGRLSTVIDPKGIVTLKEYDRLGRTIRVKEAYGQTEERWTLTQYDGLSNVVKLIADTGKNDTFSNGAWTTESPITDSQVTTYTFSDTHDATLATQVQYPDGDSVDDNVKIAYNLDGTVATRMSQKKSGQHAVVMTFDYDSLRRPWKQRVTADGTGTDVTVRSIVRTFDTLGRPDKVTTYSQANPTIGTDTPVNEVAYEYSNFGTLAKEYQEHSGAKGGSTLYVGYDYDTTAASGVLTKAMRLKDVRYPNGRLVYNLYTDTDGTQEISGVGDQLSRLTAISSSSTRPNDSNVYAAYSYNGAGRMVVEDFKGPQVRLDYWGQTARTYSGFDRFGRVAHQWWRNYGSTPADLDECGYGYDRNSNRNYKENLRTTGKSELYTYDNLNRLTAYDRGDLNGGKTAVTNKNHNEAWTLSPTGNWTEYKIDSTGSGSYTGAANMDQTRTFNLANEIYNSTAGNAITELSGQVAWADPAYDARGNMTSIPKPADMTGAFTCKYDAWNRLAEVDDGSTVIATYRYDGLGRRVSKTVNGTTYDDYFNANWQILEERKSGSSNPYIQYVWSARYVDSPILRDRYNTDGTVEDTLYYCTDANMNVTALVNTSGAVVERYAYDAYGNVHVMDNAWAARSSSSYANEILYCGYRLDSETGLYQVRNRVYHPLLGTWVQRDPMRYIDGMGLYQYCRSMPFMLRDPLGLGTTWDHVWNYVAGGATVVAGGALAVTGTLAAVAPEPGLTKVYAVWALTTAGPTMALGTAKIIATASDLPDASKIPSNLPALAGSAAGPTGEKIGNTINTAANLGLGAAANLDGAAEIIVKVGDAAEATAVAAEKVAETQEKSHGEKGENGGTGGGGTGGGNVIPPGGGPADQSSQADTELRKRK